MVEFLRTKLFIPPLRSNLVPRPRLVKRLSEGLQSGRRLALVSAPAGFGKTTLVVNWLRQAGIPAAWLSLDEGDNDLPRLLAYLAAALQQVDEGIGASLLSALQSPQLPAVDKLLTALLNEIALRTDPLILVLDDYHLLTDEAVLEAMEFLLHRPPPQLFVVLTTREDPDLPLARLRARDQLTEIRALDLRFTQAETNDFLRGVMGLYLSSQDVAALENRTEGWAVGLQLAGLSMQRQTDIQAFITDFSGSHRYILDYLTDEVLLQQPESIRSFLLQTAILDRLSAPLCDALTGRNDSDQMLAHLEAANLFCVPLDEGRRWYRYHHLFSDLLRSQLARWQPEWIPELHQRASRWYEANGDIWDAVEHALQDPDPSRAAILIEKHSILKIYQGDVTRVVGWFDRLPEAALGSAPMLCINKAWAMLLVRRETSLQEVDLALQAAERALDQANASQELRDLVAGNIASIRAFLLQHNALIDGKAEELIALTQEAQRLLPEYEKAIRSVNGLHIGYGYMALSDMDTARNAFRQTLEDGLAGGNFYAAIYGPMGLGLCAMVEGKLREVLQVCITTIDQFNRILAGQTFLPIGVPTIMKGSILLENNCLAEAEQALTEGLDLVQWLREYDAHRRGYAALARLRAIQGDRPAMLAALQALDEAWPGSTFFTAALRQRLLVRHWPEDAGVLNDARTWLAQSGIEFEKLPVINTGSPFNMATFETYLFAAHVAARLARRSKGKPDAYPLEQANAFLKRQLDFAASRGLTGPILEIAIARTLLYEAMGKRQAALEALEMAICAAEPEGYLRIFVDECDPLQALLEELRPRLAGERLVAYARRLLDSMRCEPEKPEPAEGYIERLSERELEVLRALATGLTYEQIGQQLFLSLNTVQFHIKNIYSKLLVNKRVLAIEKAREMDLI